LPLEIFTQRNFVADFIRFQLIFAQKMRELRFLCHPFAGVRGNVRSSSMAHWNERG